MRLRVGLAKLTKRQLLLFGCAVYSRLVDDAPSLHELEKFILSSEVWISEYQRESLGQKFQRLTAFATLSGIGTVHTKFYKLCNDAYFCINPLIASFEDFAATVRNASEDKKTERIYQKLIIQDISQSPGCGRYTIDWQPIVQQWKTESVITMIETIENGNYNVMPYLGDALEEAGCTNENILNHCKTPVHVPGCWVMDFLKR